MHATRQFRRLAGATLLAALALGAIAPVWATAMAASPAQFLKSGDGRIAYDDTGGSGPLVLAIPGMGDLRSQYRFIAPELAAAGFRVVTLDLRGHGDTSVQWNDYSAHAIGRDALTLIAHLGAGPAIILGNSFAAGSALWAAHDAPAQVRGVVLLGPVVRDAPSSWFARFALRLGFAGPWRVWFWTTYWNSLFPTRTPADHAQARAALNAKLHEPGRMEALWTMIGLSKAETAALLPESRVPALIIMGSLDPDFTDPAEEARWLTASLRARLLMVEGAGHYPQVEMPEKILPTLLDFLKEQHAEARQNPVTNRGP